MREISYSQAVNEGIHQAMSDDSSVICYGLGVTDPKAVFGTTSGLLEKFGDKRVFDVPTSENAMTGIGIGAAISGTKVLMTHQRLDFFLLAMDQLVNGAAKWHYMFGGQSSVPITIRLIVGRGWGQGPTHSQNLQAWFAHIPGLKVALPVQPTDAKGMLYEAIMDPDPVILLEHRWLHDSVGHVANETYSTRLDKAKVLRSGNDITILSLSYLVIESLYAQEALNEFGISAEVVDICSVNPIDWETIQQSVKKTGRLIVTDTGFQTCSVASEIIAWLSINCFSFLKAPPVRLAMPDVPEPTSFGLTKNFHIEAIDIFNAACDVIGVNHQLNDETLPHRTPHDVPGTWFKGPF